MPLLIAIRASMTVFACMKSRSEPTFPENQTFPGGQLVVNLKQLRLQDRNCEEVRQPRGFPTFRGGFNGHMGLRRGIGLTRWKAIATTVVLQVFFLLRI